MDWWNKCRTCRFWQGDREKMMPGLCSNPESDLHNEETWTEGHCEKWDSFDIETALKLMEHPEIINTKVALKLFEK